MASCLFVGLRACLLARLLAWLACLPPGLRLSLACLASGLLLLARLLAGVCGKTVRELGRFNIVLKNLMQLRADLARKFDTNP